MPEGSEYEDSEDKAKAVLEAIDARIEACENGIDQWWTAVANGKEGDDSVSWHSRKIILWKCQYLLIALREARSSPKRKKWKNCCNAASKFMKKINVNIGSNPETVRRWHRIFRKNNNKFPHPNPQAAAGITPDPPFFIQYPDAKLSLIRKAENLLENRDLSVSTLHEYTNDILVPRLLKEHNELVADESERVTRLQFLQNLGFLKKQQSAQDDWEENISHGTIRRWLHALGFQWCKTRKHFYSDRHEDPVTVAYRTCFIERYMFCYEPRAHRWIQVHTSRANELRESNGVPEGAGIDFITADGKEMTEFHVDDNKQFAEYMNQSTKEEEKFGGRLSCLFLQVPAKLANDWRVNDWLREGDYSYHYETDLGQKLVELHALHFVPAHRGNLEQVMEEHNLAFSHSVRLPLIMLGQDEVIFKQFIAPPMEWRGKDGKGPMIQKDDGLGLMGSGFNCRELGYGYQLSEEQLTKVNEFRRTHRPLYADEDAAKKVKGGPEKKDLDPDKSPFSVLFEYGASSEGYWTYDHMVLQTEDIVDVLDALFSSPADGAEGQHAVYVKNTTQPKALVRKYEYLMLTDHSCGHDRKQEHGLDVMNLRKEPSAAATKMRDVEITNEVGVLSNKFDHPLKLKPGDVQQLVFRNVDNFGNPERGPFWMSEQERIDSKFDQIDGETQRNMKVAELRIALAAHGVDSKGKKSVLLERCEKHVPPIPTTKTVPNVTKTGWHGKPKGVFQILWERGYIDENQKAKYTMKGPLDAEGNVQKDFSLNHLIRQCSDFVNEPTMLQHIGEKIGLLVDRTPKCTPELAGEGIEYSWAMSKGWYRRQPLSRKRGKDNFHSLVRECVGPEILTTARVRMFSRRAREYMISYHLLKNEGKQATPVNLSHLNKERKSHTDVADIGFAWISSVMKEIVSSMNRS